MCTDYKIIERKTKKYEYIERCISLYWISLIKTGNRDQHKTSSRPMSVILVKMMIWSYWSRLNFRIFRMHRPMFKRNCFQLRKSSIKIMLRSSNEIILLIHFIKNKIVSFFHFSMFVALVVRERIFIFLFPN